MPENKNTLFTIGQFAALHGINKKTLMWYAEVGIFKPAVIKDNGYRYYTYFQSATLETILLLRELDVSIREIQTYLEDRSAGNLKRLLEEKITELDSQILHLKKMRKSIISQKEDMDAIINLDLSEICIIESPCQYLVMLHTTKDMSFENEIEMVISETKKHELHRLHDASYGSMISVDSLYRGDFDNYTALYVNVCAPASKKGLHQKPRGKYLRAFCKGTWDKLPVRYMEILEYAQQNNLTLSGYAYEMGINEIAINSMEDYITQIDIPIEETKPMCSLSSTALQSE